MPHAKIFYDAFITPCHKKKAEGKKNLKIIGSCLY